MEIRLQPRRIGQTMAACQMMLPKLKKGEFAFIAGESYPDRFFSILKSLGLEVTTEECHTAQRLEPVYDDLFAIEPQIIGYTQKPKKLTGYIIKAKIE